MVVASNTSPISNLAIIGRLDLLRTQFREICIPHAVKAELDLLGYPSARKDIQQALGEEWINVRPLRDDKIARLLEATLDPGEAEAIALALELQADLVLLDETDGRSAAESAGLRVTGILGVLLHAFSRARFFVSPRLQQNVLTIAGE